MLYFLPGISVQPTLAQLEEYGIAYAIEKGYSHSPVTGPEGQKGVLVCDPAFTIGYYPDRQTWRKIPNAKAWVGINKGEKIDPEKLRRKHSLPGAMVELADGNLWEVPVARSWQSDSSSPVYRNRLPRLATQNDNGDWELSAVLPMYQEAWKLSQDYAAARWGSAGDVAPQFPFVTIADHLSGACLALSVNYRIAPVEASALGLLTEEKATAILDELVDARSFDAWMKKKASNSDPSEPASLSS